MMQNYIKNFNWQKSYKKFGKFGKFGLRPHTPSKKTFRDSQNMREIAERKMHAMECLRWNLNQGEDIGVFIANLLKIYQL